MTTTLFPASGTFEAVALCAVAYTARKHYNFVVAINFVVFRVFESQYRAADQRLAELVTEVRKHRWMP